MNKLIELLKNEIGSRVTSGNRWMVYDSDGAWIVYERKPYAKNTTVICNPSNIDEAVLELGKE